VEQDGFDGLVIAIFVELGDEGTGGEDDAFDIEDGDAAFVAESSEGVVIVIVCGGVGGVVDGPDSDTDGTGDEEEEEGDSGDDPRPDAAFFLWGEFISHSERSVAGKGRVDIEPTSDYADEHGYKNEGG